MSGFFFIGHVGDAFFIVRCRIDAFTREMIFRLCDRVIRFRIFLGEFDCRVILKCRLILAADVCIVRFSLNYDTRE